MKRKHINFLEAPIVPSLIKMTFPLFLSCLLLMAYSMVDNFWVGNLLGETGYAALTSAGSISLILSTIATGASNGVSIIISQRIGAGEDDKIRGTMAAAILIALLFSGIFSGVLEALLGPILRLFGTPENLFADAKAYLVIYLIGFFVSFMYTQLTAIYRAFGDPNFQLIGMLTGTVLNIIIDPFFIKIWSVAGAAWATLLSQTVCLVMGIVYGLRKHYLNPDFKAMKASYIGDVLGNTVPSAIQQSIIGVSSMVMVILVNRFNTTTIAAYGVFKNTENLLYAAPMAMSMSLSAIIGQCYGAKQYEKGNAYLRKGLLIGGGFELVMSALFILFAKYISLAFVREMTVANIVVTAMRTVSIGYTCYMMTNLFTARLSAIGKPLWSMVLMIIYYIVIRIPLAAYLIKTSMGIGGMWLAILISHVLACILACLVSDYFSKKLSKPSEA